MDRGLDASMAAAIGLSDENREVVSQLIAVWRKHYTRNVLRDRYYNGDVKVKDLGVSVLPKLVSKIDAKIDWAAKCVNWWADRVQFQNFNATDTAVKEELRTIARENDLENLVRKVVMSSLRHSVAFISVTQGNPEFNEPDVVISGYPATAAAAIWSDAKKRIEAALVVVDAEWNKTQSIKTPTLVYVFTDDMFITLSLFNGRWFATEESHAMGRVPVEPVAYHSTLELVDKRATIGGKQALAEFVTKRAQTVPVIIDGKAGAESLYRRVIDSVPEDNVVIPAAADLITANVDFVDAVNEGSITWFKPDSLDDSEEDELTKAVTESYKRPIGRTGGWGFDGERAAVVEAATLAAWAAKQYEDDEDEGEVFF